MAQERILVVDGAPDVLELCLRSLRAEGYMVEGVTSGHQAIEIARQEQFDLLLVDIMLNGLEVYQAIKELEFRQNVKHSVEAEMNRAL
jgi:CheY-like chemotaxis protein